MAKRMILMLGVMATLLTALGFMKFRQIQTAVQASAYQPPPEAVTSVVAQPEVWPATTGVIGTMEAVHGVMVSSDLPGTVTKINFDSGKAVHEGDIPSSSIPGKSGRNWPLSKRSAIWRRSTMHGMSNW